jgi:hypothetical protein
MNPRDIWTAMQKAALRDQPSESDSALLALRDLMVSFLDATDKDYPDSMKAMSMKQIHFLNKLHLAAGL